MLKGKIKYIISSVIIIIIIVFLMHNFHKPKDENYTQRVILLQNKITNAQIDYMQKLVRYKNLFNETESAFKEKQIAHHILNDLFKQNAILINGTGLTQFQQELKLD